MLERQQKYLRAPPQVSAHDEEDGSDLEDDNFEEAQMTNILTLTSLHGRETPYQTIQPKQQFQEFPGHCS